MSLLGFIFTLQAQAFRWASDAQWIGSSDDDQCLYSPYLAAFRLSIQFRLGVHADEASIVWGADDERLLSADMNPFEVSHEKGQTWVKLVYRQIGDSATVNVYRKGYAPADDDAHPWQSSRFRGNRLLPPAAFTTLSSPLALATARYMSTP